MKLFPIQTAVILTQMPPDEVSMALRDNTHAGGWSLFQKPSQLFQGHVEERTFSIARALREYQNSFVPEVTGKIVPDGTGARVEITMALLPFVRVFMRLWFGFLFIFGPLGIVVGIRAFALGSFESYMFIAIPIVMVAIGYALTHGAFRFEVPRTMNALLVLIKGKEMTGEPSCSCYRR